MIKNWVVPIWMLLILSICSCVNNVSTISTPAGLPTTFKALVDEGVYDSFNDVPGVSMSVFAPDLQIKWSGASGYDSRALDKLSVDDSLEKYISPKNIAMLSTDGYMVSEITIRSCLNHTSGIYDYALGGGAYMEAVSKSPNRRWTREDQLEFAMEFGAPLHKVGERYSYSDSGYILLGEIIENQVDSTLAYGLRSLLKFEELGMTSTWLESLEEAPHGHRPMVHRYYRKQDYTAWDPSIDLWGGGGLVSTTSDLSIFFNGLFNQKIFDDATTLELMLEDSNIHADNIDKNYEDYRLGVWHERMYDMNCYMHYGIWDTYAVYIADLNCTIVTNYTDGGRERLLKKAALVVKHISENKGATE